MEKYSNSQRWFYIYIFVCVKLFWFCWSIKLFLIGVLQVEIIDLENRQNVGKLIKFKNIFLDEDQ